MSFADRPSRRSTAASLAADSRGASEVLGVILAFGLVLSVLTVVQVTAVPVWVADAENGHSETLRGQVVDLDEAVLRAGLTGVEGRQRLDLSPTYSARFAFVTPPPAAGTVSTTTPANLTISNARATGAASGYWDGSDRTFETSRIEASVPYHRFDDRPTHVIEGGTVFTRHATDAETVVHHAAVNGNRLTLVAVDGELDVSTTGDETVTVTGASVGAEPIQVVSADGSSPIVVELPTGLSEASWREAVDGEPRATIPADGYRVVGGQAFVTLELPATDDDGDLLSYQLRLAKVGVGTGWTAESPAYLVPAVGNGSAVPAGGSQQVVVEVRDRFNNPVPGATVTHTEPGTGDVTVVGSAQTDADGRVTLRYDATDPVGGPTDVSFDVGVSTPGVDDLTITLEVRNP